MFSLVSGFFTQLGILKYLFIWLCWVLLHPRAPFVWHTGTLAVVLGQAKPLRRDETLAERNHHLSELGVSMHGLRGHRESLGPLSSQQCLFHGGASFAIRVQALLFDPLRK